LATASAYQRKYELSIDYYHQALEFCEAEGVLQRLAAGSSAPAASPSDHPGAVTLDELAQLYEGLGSVLHVSKRYDEAVQCLDTAITLQRAQSDVNAQAALLDSKAGAWSDMGKSKAQVWLCNGTGSRMTVDC